MAQGLEFDLKQTVLFNGSFGPREVEQLVDAIGADYAHFRDLRDAVAELQDKEEEQSPASMVRLGVCLFLLGRSQDAIETLKRGDGGALAHFYLGKAYSAMGDHAQTLQGFEAAKKAGYSPDDCVLALAKAERVASNYTAALAYLDQLSGAIEQTAEYLSQRAATVAAMGGNPTEVIALYERAVEIDGMHPGALFGLALENDRHGNDDVAIEMYKTASQHLPAHVGSLLNLGLLYEDTEQYELAAKCYERILDSYPNHPEALLFLKDTEASTEQYYDEAATKRHDRATQVLAIPVTDFELSVRSRNCLHRMGIQTRRPVSRHSFSCTNPSTIASWPSMSRDDDGASVSD